MDKDKKAEGKERKKIDEENKRKRKK